VRSILAITVALAIGGLTAGVARGDTFTLTDGTTLEGEIVSGTERGMIIRLPDGKYSDRVAWDRLTQESLKKVQANPKFARFAADYILEEEPEQKKPAKPPITVTPPERLPRPAAPALLGGLLGSGLGLAVVLLLYAANLWAAYEVSVFRAQPIWLVCGVAAVLPLLGQVLFLALPTRLRAEEAAAAAEAGAEAAAGAAEGAHKIGSGLKVAYAAPETADAAAQAAVTVFKRGEFMFNRRFFETRFPNFFGMIRRDKDRHLVLLIKTSRGEFTANRITRITANDMHVEVLRGGKGEEVSISFVEVQEVRLQPRDAH